MRNIQNKNIKWWLGVGSCVLLFVFIGAFAYSKMSFILRGVQIEAMIEHDGNSSLATIKGNAKNATYITLNGREIFIDREGNFSEPVVLIPGFSVITIDTQDKFGKTDEKKFQLVYKETAGTVAMQK